MKRAKGSAPVAAISLRMIWFNVFNGLHPAWHWLILALSVGHPMAKIDPFFNRMFEEKASDLHLSAGNPPILRINGELQRIDSPPLENDNLKTMLYEIAPEYKIKIFEETGDVDFGYEIPNISRFRANFFNQKNGI